MLVRYHLICYSIIVHIEQMRCDVSSNVPRVHKMLCDGEFLPFQDNMFDLVISNLRLVKLCALALICMIVRHVIS